MVLWEYRYESYRMANVKLYVIQEERGMIYSVRHLKCFWRLFTVQCSVTYFKTVSQPQYLSMIKLRSKTKISLWQKPTAFLVLWTGIWHGKRTTHTVYVFDVFNVFIVSSHKRTYCSQDSGCVVEGSRKLPRLARLIGCLHYHRHIWYIRSFLYFLPARQIDCVHWHRHISHLL